MHQYLIFMLTILIRTASAFVQQDARMEWFLMHIDHIGMQFWITKTRKYRFLCPSGCHTLLQYQATGTKLYVSAISGVSLCPPHFRSAIFRRHPLNDVLGYF